MSQRCNSFYVTRSHFFASCSFDAVVSAKLKGLLSMWPTEPLAACGLFSVVGCAKSLSTDSLWWRWRSAVTSSSLSSVTEISSLLESLTPSSSSDTSLWSPPGALLHDGVMALDDLGSVLDPEVNVSAVRFLASSSLLCLRHLARLFLNHTCKAIKSMESYIMHLL